MKSNKNIYYIEKKLLRRVKNRCWLTLCFPKEIKVKVRILPQYVDTVLISMFFRYENKLVVVSIGHDMGDLFEYKFFTTALLLGFKRYLKKERVTMKNKPLKPIILKPMSPKIILKRLEQRIKKMKHLSVKARARKQKGRESG